MVDEAPPLRYMKFVSSTLVGTVALAAVIRNELASTRLVLSSLPSPAATAPVEGPAEDMVTACTENRHRTTSGEPETVELPAAIPVGALLPRHIIQLLPTLGA